MPPAATTTTAAADAQSRWSTAAARRSERRRISGEGLGVWTRVEHDRFLQAKRLYPNGPWKLVAEFVGTRNTRQTMTHAQKYRQKLERRRRGLRTTRKISEFEHVLSPELFFPSSPTPSDQCQSPLKPTQSMSTSPRVSSESVFADEIETMAVDDHPDNSNVTISLANYFQSAPLTATCAKLGGFEQLLMDDDTAFCLNATHTLVALESIPLSDNVVSSTTAAAAADKTAVEARCLAHLADAELPWLDEYFDYLIDNLR